LFDATAAAAARWVAFAVRRGGAEVCVCHLDGGNAFLVVGGHDVEILGTAKLEWTNNKWHVLGCGLAQGYI
jgi:hypothetical protein